MFFGSIATNKKNNTTPCIIVKDNAKHRRAFLSAPGKKASITLEASLVVPIYICFIVAILYIFKILEIQNYVNQSMEEAARKTNTYAYSLSVLEKLPLSDKKEILSDDSFSASNIARKYAYLELTKAIFLNEDTVSYLDHSKIKNGSKGLKFMITKDGFFSDVIDFNVSYIIKLPFVSEKLLSIYINQRCYFKTFTGEDITDKTGGHTEYVYVTATGSVYHTSPYCSYLSKSYSVLSRESFEDILQNTSTYSPCSNCAKNTPLGVNCLMCPGSQVYHTDPTCFYLNAKIYKVTLDSTINKMPLCHRCQKGITK